MKVVIQRVERASVSVNNKLINEIEGGLLLLVGFGLEETTKDIDYMVNKIINLRVFDDEKNIMNKSIIDVGGQILSISQFTLNADTKKGNRPSYVNALNKDDAIKLYELFNKKLNEKVKTLPGVFGAQMKIELINDGPLTIIIDSKA